MIASIGPTRAILRIAVVAGVIHTIPVAAQQPPAQPPPHIAAYRAPVIALVQPSSGGSVPQDQPVVVFRFAPGEPGDPLDVASFRIAVDGVDQSARFQVAASEAWGPIGIAASLGSTETDAAIAPGAHQILARICSSRGACVEANALVTVVPSAVRAEVSETKTSRKARVIDALLTAVKKVLQTP